MKKLHSLIIVLLTMLVVLNPSYAANNSTLAKFKNDYELLFVYSSSCEYCRKFSPVFKQWGDNKSLKIRAVTVNNDTLPSFPNAESDPDAISRYGISGLPAIVVINRSTKSGSVFSEGSMSKQDLEQRFNSFLQDKY